MKLHRSFIVAALVAAVVPVVVPAVRVEAQEVRAAAPVVFSTEQLDNLVAPIALYPDAILAQVLVAATFPDQIEFAAKYVRANGTRGIDDQAWDVSVRAIAHYAPVLNMLADRPDWTTALGQAYAAQSSDVMESVQHLRQMAHAEGNLPSTSQQTVIVEDQNIRIVPAQPQVIYVPTYDPEIVYYRPVQIVGFYSGFWSFGIGFPIGGWLSYDCDWYGRRVYYDGWRSGGWRAASYPFISLSTYYVSPRYQTVYVNHDVGRRPVNYGNLGRYNTVHRTVGWDGRGRGDYRGNDRGDNRNNNRSPGPIQRGAPGAAEQRNGQVNPQGRTPSWTLPPSGPSRRDQGNNQGNGNNGRNNGANDQRTARDRNQQGNPQGNQQGAPPVIIQRPSRPVIEQRAQEQARSAPPQQQSRNAPPPQARSSTPPPSRGSAPPPSKGGGDSKSRGGDSKGKGSSRGG